MGFNARLLAENEHIVLDLRPHVKALAQPVFVLLAVCGAGGYTIARFSEPAARYAAVGAAALVLALFAVVPFLRWRTTHFVVTDRRVLVRTGVLSRSGRDVPLSRINDITFSHSLLERLLGTGTLVIESAGERGQVVLTDVPRVEQVQRQVYDLVEETDNRLRGSHHEDDGGR